MNKLQKAKTADEIIKDIFSDQQVKTEGIRYNYRLMDLWDHIDMLKEYHADIEDVILDRKNTGIIYIEFCGNKSVMSDIETMLTLLEVETVNPNKPTLFHKIASRNKRQIVLKVEV